MPSPNIEFIEEQSDIIQFIKCPAQSAIVGKNVDLETYINFRLRNNAEVAITVKVESYIKKDQMSEPIFKELEVFDVEPGEMTSSKSYKDLRSFTYTAEARVSSDACCRITWESTGDASESRYNSCSFRVLESGSSLLKELADE